MMNIVVPMAGRGRRFAKAGFTAPKPHIRLAGKPQLQPCLDNVRPHRPPHFTFILLRHPL